MQNIGEDNQKDKKIGQTINQVIAPMLEHDKIRALWALDVSLENMMERV